MLPKLSVISLSSGVAVSSTGFAFALDLKCSCWFGLMPTMRCIWPKLSMVEPSILTTRSPGLKPARSAALPGLTMSTLAAVLRSPKKVKIGGEDDDGEQEIGDRPGRDDRRAGAKRLALETVLALFLGHALRGAADRRWLRSRRR